VGLTQEGLHSIKVQKLSVEVVKIDLLKAYDRISWLYLCLLLLRIVFSLPVIKWIMSCVISNTFVFLINGAGLKFFKRS
jgi:hypothetical protein